MFGLGITIIYFISFREGMKKDKEDKIKLSMMKKEIDEFQ